MGKRDHTDMGGSGYRFLTTHWSLIEGVQDNDGHQFLIGSLLERYWKPVYCYLRRRGLRNEEAKDVTQGFFHEIVLNGKLIERADRHKGRFRTFLLHALDHYLSNENRKALAKKRHPSGSLFAMDMSDMDELPELNPSWTPEDYYHYAWISDLLEKVLAEVEEQCRQDNLEVHWQVFRERVLESTMNNAAAPSLADICAKYHIDSERRASNMVVTVKRRFQNVLRKHVRQSVSTEEQVSDELADIFRYFP